MNYLKYFRCANYNRKEYNCWHFVQDVFKGEHNFTLPDLPIMTDGESVTYLKSNIDYKIVEKAQKGCIILFSLGDITHVGYAINEKEFIHKNKQTSAVAKIPQNAVIYEVLR